jgi:dipeptidyl aminopeptidase/acylaminoacyl peptidase
MKLMLLILICSLLTNNLYCEEIEEEVYLQSFDGTYIPGFLRIPDGQGPHSAVMIIHGGIGGTSMRSIKSRCKNGYVQNHLYADGYAIFQVDYREYHFGDEELEDIVSCYYYLMSRPEIDKNRIGIVGGSHGGYLALMLATRLSPAAVVAFAGIADVVWKYYEEGSKLADELKDNFEWREKRYHHGKTIREESELMSKGSLDSLVEDELTAREKIARDVATRWGDNIEIYKRYSPIEQYKKIHCPVLYIVGSEDINKPAGKSLIEKLQDLGRVAEYSEHPGMKHGFYWGKKWQYPDHKLPLEFYRSLKRTTDFLQKWVKEN